MISSRTSRARCPARWQRSTRRLGSTAPACRRMRRARARQSWTRRTTRSHARLSRACCAMPELIDLAGELADRGFAFVTGDAMRPLLGALPDWDAFAASWNDLGVDEYLAGRYRRRRHALYAV